MAERTEGIRWILWRWAGRSESWRVELPSFAPTGRDIESVEVAPVSELREATEGCERMQEDRETARACEAEAVQELRDLLAACKTWRSSLTANSLYEPNDADQKLFEAIDRADLKDDEEKGSADGC